MSAKLSVFELQAITTLLVTASNVANVRCRMRLTERDTEGAQRCTDYITRCDNDLAALADAMDAEAP